MRPRPIYRKVGDANYILCYCPNCGHLQPVEDHGRDGCAACERLVPTGLTFEEASRQGKYMTRFERTPLENIPYNCRNESGTYMVRRPPLESSP